MLRLVIQPSAAPRRRRCRPHGAPRAVRRVPPRDARGAPRVAERDSAPVTDDLVERRRELLVLGRLALAHVMAEREPLPRWRLTGR